MSGLERFREILAILDSGVEAALAVTAGVAVGIAAYTLLFRFLRRTADRTETVADDAFVAHARTSLRFLLPVLCATLALQAAGDSGTATLLQHLLRLLLVLAGAWFLTSLLRVGEELVLTRYRVDVADNLRARKIHTQLEIIRKILVVFIAVLAVAVILMSYDAMREVGAGLLASAGIAGIILGFAARPTLGNLLAGIQIALTQPIRIDDVVVVEGEWGRIEEITLTYVVVRIWDLRRLVLPISHFIEQPFQNWTRTSASILGTVHVYVDYTVPVEEVREALGEIVEASEHFDGEVWRLHVTGATERTVELRALMSANDSPTAWELRCQVREELLAWLRREHPDGLPRARVSLEPDGDDDGEKDDRRPGIRESRGPG